MVEDEVTISCSRLGTSKQASAPLEKPRNTIKIYFEIAQQIATLPGGGGVKRIHIYHLLTPNIVLIHFIHNSSVHITIKYGLALL